MKVAGQVTILASGGAPRNPRFAGSPRRHSHHADAPFPRSRPCSEGGPMSPRSRRRASTARYRPSSCRIAATKVKTRPAQLANPAATVGPCGLQARPTRAARQAALGNKTLRQGAGPFKRRAGQARQTRARPGHEMPARCKCRVQSGRASAANDSPATRQMRQSVINVAPMLA